MLKERGDERKRRHKNNEYESKIYGQRLVFPHRGVSAASSFPVSHF